MLAEHRVGERLLGLELGLRRARLQALERVALGELDLLVREAGAPGDLGEDTEQRRSTARKAADRVIDRVVRSVGADLAADRLQPLADLDRARLRGAFG